MTALADGPDPREAPAPAERDDRLDRLEAMVGGMIKHLTGNDDPGTGAVTAPAPEVAIPTAPAPPQGAAGTADLMDLGHDAQLQGTALGLRSIANRLAVVSEGLKLIPALQNIAQDVAQLNYPELSEGVDKLVSFAKSEDERLMGELAKRTAARQASTPPA